MGKLGTPVYIAATLFIVLFNTLYCFRRSLPPPPPHYSHVVSISLRGWGNGEQATLTPVPSAYAMPVSVEIMNYNSVILVGVVALTGIWWLIHARKHYPGPKVMTLYIHSDKQSLVTDGVLVADKGEKAS